MKIYLAIPYTGNEKDSFEFANKTAGELISQGHIVFSPISHTHPIAVCCGLPKDWEFWRKFDEAFIAWADELWIANFGDWRKSTGVKSEIEIAERLNKPVYYII